MADNLMGNTEVAATSQEVISNLVQSYLIQSSYLAGTITDYSNLAVKGAKSISIPRSGGFNVASKSENTVADATAISYSTDTIDLVNHRYIQFLLEDYADLKTNINVVQDAVMKATKDLALDFDGYIVEQLKLASVAAPDHNLVFADTLTDVIALSDILKAKALLQAQFVNTNECFIGIGPEKENELLALNNFINAYQYGSNEALVNGEIGKIYGMKVISHAKFEDFMCTWHPSAIGMAMQQGLRYQTEKDLANLGTRHSLDMIFGVKVLDNGKRNVFTDSTN